MAHHVREVVKQIDSDTWLIGDQFIIHRQQSPPAEYLWKDSDDCWYTISGATHPLPTCIPLPPDSHIRQVHDAGDASAVWSFGDAFLKVKLIPHGFKFATKEHVTLQWLEQKQKHLSFAFPKVLHHVVADDRCYLLITRVAGQVLADAWKTLKHDEKQHYASRIVEICKELSTWRSSAITGIDGAEFGDAWLDLWRPRRGFKSDEIEKTCTELGMDCSTCYFWHSDLGPHNIIINPEQQGAVGIIDWEIAGFVPLAWIRTKFGVSWAMDFAWPEVHGDDPSLREWRELVEKTFGTQGYPEVKEAWTQWIKKRHSS